MYADLIVGARLVLGAVAAVLAIAVWARGREASWLFAVFGILSLYVQVVYTVLDDAGFVQAYLGLSLASALPMLLSALPFAFFILAFAMVLVRKSHK